jgi:hypothetical protein
MSGHFLATVAIAFVLVIFWRVTVMVLVALLIALLATGIDSVAEVVTGAGEHTTVLAPAAPDAPAPDENGSDIGEPDARAQSEPPR